MEVGVATGYLLSLLGAGALAIGGSHGGVIMGTVVGSAAGAVVGVISVDPPDRKNNSKSLFLGLAGSSVGALLSLAVAASRDYSYQWVDLLAIRLCPSIGATIVSELWRDPPSLGLSPSVWSQIHGGACPQPLPCASECPRWLVDPCPYVMPAVCVLQPATSPDRGGRVATLQTAILPSPCKSGHYSVIVR